MNFETLLKKVVEKLNPDPKGPLAFLHRSENEKELVSMLRLYVFKTDVETKAFLDEFKNEKKKGEAVAESMTEVEFSLFIRKSLEEALKKKDSKFKFASCYSTNDKDLVMNVADKNGFETQYMIIALKTS